MQSNNKKKICIVVSSLGKGGAERSTALISRMLHNLMYEVHIVSILNKIDYNYRGTLLNLGEIKDKNDGFLGRFKRFLVFKKYLKNQQFDLIIDSRSRPTVIKEFLISRLLYRNQKLLYLVHSWKLKSYFSSSKFWAEKIYKNGIGFVAVSDEIKNKINDNLRFDSVTTIYNCIDIKENLKNVAEIVDFDDDFILFYGRLDDKVKNITLLIEAYKLSQLSFKKIKLLILGSGEDLNLLKEKANNENIVFKPFTNNPFPYIKKSRFTLLTSRFEGFPLVLLESLSVGKPVISVDCKSGPSEIIKHGYNGLIVRNNDAGALAEAMNRFIFDDELYQTCLGNAVKSVQKFSIESITDEWKDLIETKL